MYEIALNEKSTSSYVKVKSRFGQVAITHRKMPVAENLFYKLYYDSYDNFIFYKDGKRLLKDGKAEEVIPVIEKTIIKETIEEKPKKEKGLKKILDKIF